MGLPRPRKPRHAAVQRKHDVIFWYSKTDEWIFNDDAVREAHSEKTRGKFKQGLGGSGFIVDDYELASGKIPEDWWTMAIAGRYPVDGKKRVGYATEKPWPLLSESSSAVQIRTPLWLTSSADRGPRRLLLRHMGGVG